MQAHQQVRGILLVGEAAGQRLQGQVGLHSSTNTVQHLDAAQGPLCDHVSVCSG